MSLYRQPKLCTSNLCKGLLTVLYLLRKYQKAIFALVTVVIIVSFCFFGTYGTLSTKEVARSPESAFRAVLAHSLWDPEPNLLNPGVIEKELVATGLAPILMRPEFSRLKGELDRCMRKVKDHVIYQHPSSAEVGVLPLIRLFAPQLAEQALFLKGRSDQATMQTWALMAHLYIQQLSIPSQHTVRQFLQMQEKQEGLIPDPRLAYADLSLFGLKTMDDWLGPSFKTVACDFIYKVAKLAEQKGYKVSNTEAREALFRNVAEGYARVLRKTPSQEDVHNYYTQEMHKLGLDETALLDAWKRVLLFERFMLQESCVYTDPLAENQFAEFVKEKKEKDLYELPFDVSSFISLCKLQLYLDKVSPAAYMLRKTGLLPNTFFSKEEIARRAPELVKRSVDISFRSVSIHDLAKDISLKDVMRWEVEDTHFALLRKTFPVLGVGDTESKRVAALNKLSSKERVEVDQFAVAKIIATDKERIQSVLHEQKERKWSGDLKEGCSLFNQIVVEKQGELIALLGAKKELTCYSQDGEHFYEIVLLNASQEILSFSEALKVGYFDRQLDKMLEKASPEVRKKGVEEMVHVAFADLEESLPNGLSPLVEQAKLKGRHLKKVPLIEGALPTFMSDFYLQKKERAPLSLPKALESHALLSQDARRSLMVALMEEYAH